MKHLTKIFIAQVLMILLMQFPAIAEEELKMLTWEGYVPENQREIFKKMVKDKYGVDLKLTVKYVSEPADIYAGVKNKEGDIFTPSHNVPKDHRYKFIEGKLALPLDLNNIPNYKDIIPEFQKADYFRDQGMTYAIPFIYGPYGLAYNTGIMQNEPESWNILWDPKYAKKYAISADYYEVNIFATALAMGIAKEKIADYDAVYSPEMIEKLKYLSNNAKTLWKGVDTADDLKGLPLAASWGFAFAELKKRGETWKMSSPKEGTTGWIDCWMIGYTLSDKPALKRIAEEWINFIISPEYQLEVGIRGLSSAPVNLKVKENLTPDEITRFHLDDPAYFQKHFIPWPILDKRTRQGFQLLWEKSTK